MINYSKFSLKSGAGIKLKLNGTAKNSTVTWTSLDPEYVSVNPSTGKVTALKYKEETDGKVTVKAIYNGVDYPCYTCEITVVRPTVKKTEISVGKGKSNKIVVGKTALNAKNGGITFTSSDESIATVNKNGKVFGVAKGQCVITVKLAGIAIPVNITVR